MDNIKNDKGHISLVDRLERFYGKPVNEIQVVGTNKLCWGEPVGEEILADFVKEGETLHLSDGCSKRDK